MLAQNERYHGRPDGQQFCFSCLMRYGRVRKRFLNDLGAFFWQKGAPTVNLEKNWGVTFLREYIKVEGRTWHNALSSISSVHWAIYNLNK